MGPLDAGPSPPGRRACRPPPSRPGCRGTPGSPRSAPACPARHRPIAPSPSHTSTRGTAPSPAISCHQPANRSSALPGRDQHRRQPPRVPRTPSSAPAAASPAADLPEPDRQRDRREPEITLRDLARRIRGAGRRIRRQIRRPQLRHPARSTRIDRSQPIRSAITVAGIVGYASSSSRIRGSTASTTDPARGRSYFGGPSLATAARTVFLETPITRAISLIGISSARCSRRISAQSSTDSTPSPPGSA